MSHEIFRHVKKPTKNLQESAKHHGENDEYLKLRDQILELKEKEYDLSKLCPNPEFHNLRESFDAFYQQLRKKYPS
jgi:hypothetical protein